MVYCSQCGEKNPDGAKYCFNCGAHLIYEKDIEDDSKKSVSPEVVQRDIKLVGDDLDLSGLLNKENLQNDIETLQVCNNDILDMVGRFNRH